MNHENFAADMFEAKQVPNTLAVEASNDAEVQIQPWHRRVIAYADAAGGGAYTLRLPYAAMCKGVRISIIARITGVVAVTLSAKKAAELANQTLDADKDAVVVESDGAEWHILANEIA